MQQNVVLGTKEKFRDKKSRLPRLKIFIRIKNIRLRQLRALDCVEISYRNLSVTTTKVSVTETQFPVSSLFFTQRAIPLHRVVFSVYRAILVTLFEQ